MERTAFTNPSGELVTVRPAGERPYLSFVPHPLPPASEAEAIAHVRELLSEADQALGELIGVGRVLPNPDLLVRPYLRQEAVASSAIEGTRASFTDLVAYEAGGAIAQGSDVIDIVNYTGALDFGLNAVRDDGITPDLVRRIHRRLMSGARGERYATPGEFRTLQNHIGGGREPADGDFVPPPPERMQSALTQFFAYIDESNERQTPLLVEAAWVHYQFETIHPFIDGNGRVGRVLIPLLIAYRRSFPHPLLFLSPYFRQHRTEYNDLLFEVSAQSSWWKWLAFFLEAVRSQATSAIILSDKVLGLGREWHERLDALKATHTAHRLADFMHQHIGANAGMISAGLGVSGPTTYSAIKTIEAAGIAEEITGRPRDQVWLARELVRLLD